MKHFLTTRQVTLKLQHHGQLEVVNGCHQGFQGHLINGTIEPHGFVFRGDSVGNGETFKLIPVILRIDQCDQIFK